MNNMPFLQTNFGKRHIFYANFVIYFNFSCIFATSMKEIQLHIIYHRVIFKVRR